MTLGFVDGTLEIDDRPQVRELLAGLAVVDDRVGRLRAPGSAYAAIRRALHGRVACDDRARAYDELELSEQGPRPLRPYQAAALEAWETARRRGVVVLPTGAGKTYVAVKAILACARGTLVCAPTIDLVQQWARELGERLRQPIGVYGGGEKRLEAITVSTYDSAVLLAPHRGNRFGLLVCDECHHLPAPATTALAECCIAPWRLGLTATPERTDGGHERLVDLLGPIVHQTAIDELEGRFLATYQAEVLEVALDPDEAEAYAHHREIYLTFVRARGIRFDRPDGWQQFLTETARASDGRAVLASWREQRRLARASRAKLRVCWRLLCEHAGERCLVFTDDNATAYAIGRAMVLPVLTHHTRPAERRAFLDGFRAGTYPALVTSRVLNEGVDVPEATVGIVISGTGSVREHVQRLGRLLRPGEGKVARLYELVAADTAEGFTSARRRSHAAFDGEADDGTDLTGEAVS